MKYGGLILTVLFSSFLSDISDAGLLSCFKRNGHIKTTKERKLDVNCPYVSRDRGLPELLHIFKGFPSFYSSLTKKREGNCQVLNSGAGHCMFERQIYSSLDHFTKGENINKYYTTKCITPITPPCISDYAEHDQETIDQANSIKGYKTNIKITSLDYSIPTGFIPHENHSIISGVYFEQVTNKKILKKTGKFDVIIDCFGCFNYANNNNHRIEILKRYIDLAQNNGEIYLYCSKKKLHDFLLNKNNIKEIRGEVEDISYLPFNRRYIILIKK